MTSTGKHIHCFTDCIIEPLPSVDSAAVAERHSSNISKGSKCRLRRLIRACWTLSPSWEKPIGEEEAAEEEEDKKKDNDPDQAFFAALPDDVLLQCLGRLPRPSLGSSMMVCQKWRSLLKSPQFYEQRKWIGKLENLIFVLGGGGSGASAVYCTSAEGWELFENIWPLDYHNADCHTSFLHAQPVSIKQRIYILGVLLPGTTSNFDGQDCTLVYDVWTQLLTRKAPMQSTRKKFACGVIAGKVYVAGGARRRDSQSKESLMDAEEYNPEFDVWKTIASMPRKRYGCLGAAVNDTFYVIGGLKSSMVSGLCMQPFAYMGSMDAYNTKTNTWQKTKTLPMLGCVIACTVVSYCIYMLSSLAVELSFWKYDTQNDSWTKMKPPPIPSPLRLDGYLKFSCVTVGMSVYIIQVGGSIDDLLRRSGRSARGYKEGLVLIFDTLLEEWSRGPDLPLYIKNGAACAVVEC